MKRRPFRTEIDPRRGVALIVVLGFLAVLILMALAFLLQARTERLVADATMGSQIGRQLVRTAVNAAMNDYSVRLFGGRLLLPTAALSVFPSAPPTPAVDMGRTLGQDGIRLMSGEAENWLPRRFLTPETEAIAEQAEWILVREDPGNAHSRILGRYAYVCFDMSGGIDANRIAQTDGAALEGIADSPGPHQPIARSSVRDTGMGQLDETGDVGEFQRLRRGWHGFDNLAELILLTNGKYNGGENATAITYMGVDYNYNEEGAEAIRDIPWNPPAAPRWREARQERNVLTLVSSRVADLVPYSLAAYRGVYDIATASWSAPQLCDATANWNAALAPVAGQLVDPAAAIRAIQDYLDPSPVPQGVDYPSSKNVPMLNELKTDFRLRFVPASAPDPAQLLLDVRLELETWYPFPSADNPDGLPFAIPVPDMQGGTGAVAGTPNIWIQLVRILGIPQAALEPVTGPAGPLAFASAYNGGLPAGVAGTLDYTFRVKPANTNLVPGPGTRIQLLMDIANRAGPSAGIEVRSGPAVVDRLKAQGQMVVLAPDSGWQTFYNEVRDPRLNHDPGEWVAGSGTLGQINDETRNSAAFAAEGRSMYCRNGPMQTPAELGFIPAGRPWETIDLCTVEGADMLSRLVVDPAIPAAIAASGAYYMDGTINPNTSSTNVLKTAFAGLATREVPNAPLLPPDPVTDDQARQLAESMIADSVTKEIQAGGGAFLSGADWARTTAMADGAILGLSENRRETLIRNTWGLFSPNSSLFTAVVIGQAIKEGPGPAGVWDENEDRIDGERRAVALVWRDPFPSTGGFHHEMFVRMFKFLDE